MAVGYQGSDDGGDLLPEKQYGFAVLLGGILENTSLAFEYPYGEFENNDETSLLTEGKETHAAGTVIGLNGLNALTLITGCA